MPRKMTPYNPHKLTAFDIGDDYHLLCPGEQIRDGDEMYLGHNPVTKEATWSPTFLDLKDEAFVGEPDLKGNCYRRLKELIFKSNGPETPAS